MGMKIGLLNAMLIVSTVLHLGIIVTEQAGLFGVILSAIMAMLSLSQIEFKK